MTESGKILGETEDLILRSFRASDWKDLYVLLSDPELLRYEEQSPLSLEEARCEAAGRAESDEWIALERKTDGELVGSLMASSARTDGTLEFGCMIRRDCQKRGYAFESAVILFRHLSSLGNCRRITARCDEENLPCRKLLEKLGMIPEKISGKDHFFRRNADGSPHWSGTCFYVLPSPAGKE